ncbi:hypothetical protein [Gracilibacillus lacisalsi]|uniref:hypothetical protein n=1 Tax=Gracilibacillus lacisalsi TaxID=393087 RepID=UPI00037CB5E1|nr:hypothetical protein [Gracilibacillus lacisalsi]
MVKKIVYLVAFVSILLVSFNVVSADNLEGKGSQEASTTSNVGVSNKPPTEEGKKEEITPFGVYPPSQTHDISKSGRMSFSGKANTSNLWTNKYFTGSSSYKIWFNNKSSSTLKVELWKDGFWSDSLVKTYYISSDRFGYPSGLDHNAKYYLLFHAPSNFDGYIDM